MRGKKYLRKCLAVSKRFCTFAVPNSLFCFGNQNDSLKNRNKAGFLCLSCSKTDSEFGDLKGGSPLLHTANFSTRMPNSTKTCQTGNNSTGSATANARNSVKSDTYYNKGRYTQLKGQYNKALRRLAELRASQSECRELHTYRVRLSAFHSSGEWAINKDYKATSRAEAVGLAFLDITNIMPNCTIAPGSTGNTQISTLII
jgi:hypothetical protein